MELAVFLLVSVVAYLAIMAFTAYIAMKIDQHFWKRNYRTDDIFLYGLAGLLWPLTLLCVVLFGLAYFVGLLVVKTGDLE